MKNSKTSISAEPRARKQVLFSEPKWMTKMLSIAEDVAKCPVKEKKAAGE